MVPRNLINASGYIVDKNVRGCSPEPTARVRGILRKSAIQTQPRGSYPDRMVGENEEPEKASWSQEHHLKDEEGSINTINKHTGWCWPEEASDLSPRPAL